MRGEAGSGEHAGYAVPARQAQGLGAGGLVSQITPSLANLGTQGPSQLHCTALKYLPARGPSGRGFPGPRPCASLRATQSQGCRSGWGRGEGRGERGPGKAGRLCMHA